MDMNKMKHSGTTDPSLTQRETENREISLKAACEGIVLLKNEDDLLPLAISQPLALYGAGAVATVKGGTGSGDVNCRDQISIYEGMKEEGFRISSQAWLDTYKDTYTKSRQAWKEEILRMAGDKTHEEFFDIYSRNGFVIPEGGPISEEDLQDAATAVYVISRIAGEGADRTKTRGDYYLSEKELSDLTLLSENCDNIVVVINAGGPIDLEEIDTFPEIRSLIFMGQVGMDGGKALARVLSGYVNPSGKLTDTWALAYEDYPSAGVFGMDDGDVTTEPYVEGIYVGYRYFDSFGVRPRFAFGHGLSYTDFQIEKGPVSCNQGTVKVQCTVKNTGHKGGKETVQVYLACPQMETAREWKRLAAFKKTDFLSPGESQEMEITFSVDVLSSYREESSSWVIEDGLYGLFLGNASDQLQVAGILQVAETCIIRKTRPICPLQEDLEEIVRPDDLAREFSASWRREAARQKVPRILVDVYPEEDPAPVELDEEVRKTLEEWSDDELIAAVVGEISGLSGGVTGAAGIAVPGTAGEINHTVPEKTGKPLAVLADGPAGLRLIKSYYVHKENDSLHGHNGQASFEGGLFARPPKKEEDYDKYYQYCTAFPTGIALAQTWNQDLVEEVGQAVARELREFGVRLWLAPGMNIHRNPLCGRNFEYYSEDPLLTGFMAGAMTRGVQKEGDVGTTIKHFCCNNQEDNRMGYNAVVSEQALREIYLKGFQIAIRESSPHALMTAYNVVNGVHAANSYDLCTQVARKEWGFRGLIMTDWTTTWDCGGSKAWKCIQAGNDLIMPGCQEDHEDIKNALANGDLSREELLTCATRIVSL